MITFGLNALLGRHLISHNVWGGDWDNTNTYDLINYTISKGYKIDSWEFGKTNRRKSICYDQFYFIANLFFACCHIGNELSGKGIGASVGAVQYGKDLIKLKQNLHTLYKDTNFKPSLIAPGGFYQKEWFDKLLQVSGSGVVDVMTHHVYNLGPGFT
jgi:heparanase 1